MRYKEYNVNRVLEKSIALFWQKGFNGCAISEIVESTGVNRFSLYQEFGNKEGILYHSLKLYRERQCPDKLQFLEADGNLVDVLKAFYMAFWEDLDSVNGCYIIHVGTELADSDERVKTFMDAYLTELHSLFYNLLMKHGYRDTEAHFKARHLVGLYCTTMSFCLIHTPEEREEYTLNGIKLIIN
jgi:TetR/AcrR family transcriptional repressor of nem operon